MTATREWTRLEASVRGLRVMHRMREGDGAPVLLVHGVGPGTDGEANFAPLIKALAADVPVHVIDLAGFGGSARKPYQPGFDVPLWLEQVDQALDRIGRPAVLVGNSVGGALALKTAARRRELRGVLAIGAPAAPMVPTPELTAFWRAPRDQAALALAMRPMTAAQLAPTPQAVTARWRPFIDPAYAAWFDESLARPADCLAAAALTKAEAAAIDAPTRLIHGLQDRACPAAPLAAFVFEHLPMADLTLLGACGHNVIAERTADVLAAVDLLRRKGLEA